MKIIIIKEREAYLSIALKLQGQEFTDVTEQYSSADFNTVTKAFIKQKHPFTYISRELFLRY